MARSYFKSWLVLSVSLLALFNMGCGGGDNSASMMRDAIDSNIKRTAAMYGLYLARNKNVGPADEAAFKKFLSEVSAERLEIIGVDPSDREGILTSDRDGKPFKFRWGVEVVPRGPSIPVVFEAEGVEGKYMVGFTSSAPREVEKSDYDKMWAGELNDNEGAERPGN